MTGQYAEAISLGEQLLGKGWTQGALFRAPGAVVAYNTWTTDENGKVVMKVEKRPVKSSEKLVLITQDCDVLAADVSRVEALICRVEKRQEYLDNIDRNSARAFVVDPQAKLVAVAMYPVVLAKEALLAIEPEPWPGTKIRRMRFIQWLGRRYTRPVVPDSLVDAFDKPVIATFERLAAEHSEVVQSFNKVVREMRVNLPESEEMPYSLHVVLLAHVGTDELSSESLEHIEEVWRAILDRMQPEQAQLDPELDLKSAEEMSVAEYFATRPVFMDYLSYHGDEITGALPHGAT